MNGLPGQNTEIRDNRFPGPTAINTGAGDQINHFLAASPERRGRVLAGLPAEPSRFVGRRKELARLLKALNPEMAGTSTVLVCAVGGLAGVGKSALAVHAARHAVAEGWFHGAAFINLRGYEVHDAAVDVAGAVPVLLRALGADGELPPTPEERLAVYHGVLAQLAQEGKQVLLVLDNVADPAQVEGLLPGGVAHRVVVTSRQSLGSLRARLLDLDVLDESDAVELLAVALRDARPDDSRAELHDELAQLAAVCGRLPLALQIAAALLKVSPRRTVVSLVEELANERTRLELLCFPDSALRPGVRAALAVSYRRLPAAQKRLLRLAAIDPGSNMEAQAVVALADLPLPQTSRLLYALEGSYLLTCDESGQRWGMHDLVRLYGREQLQTADDPQEEEQARRRLLEHYQAMADAADNYVQPLSTEHVPNRFNGRAEAVAWFDANRANLVGAVGLAARHQCPEITLRLALSMTEFFAWRRHFEDWIDTHTLALEAARSLCDRRGEGNVLTAFGNALRRLRRFEEAIDAHQQAATIFREIEDEQREGVSLTNLGLALIEVRRFEEAIRTLQRAVTIMRETGAPQREGFALANLGIALVAVRRCQEAINVLEQSAVIHRKAGNLHGEGMVLTNLSAALIEVRRFEEAIDALDRTSAVFGQIDDRHREGTALNNLGIALVAVRRFEEAIDAHRKAATLFHEAKDRHNEGMALTSLGWALVQVQRFDDGIGALERGATLFREAEDRHSEGMALTNLGLGLVRARRIKDGIGALERGITIFQETSDRHREGMALTNLGLALVQVQRIRESISVLERAVTIFRETGDRHSEGTALTNRGLALIEVRQFEGAAAAYRHAVAIFQETGDRHSEGSALHGLGIALRAMHRFEECRTAWHQARSLFAAIGAKDEMTTVQSLLEQPLAEP